MTSQPPTPAEEITALLAALYDRVETREIVIARRTIQRGQRLVPVAEPVPHRTRRPGLVNQLGVIAGPGSTGPGRVQIGAAVPARSPGWDPDGALSPMTIGGRAEAPEPVTDAWHVSREIDQAVTALTASARVSGYGSLVEVALADEDLGKQVAAYLRRLVARARIAAGYDVRIVTLRDIVCPECGSDLRVRTDASSAVWCSGNALGQDDEDELEECGLTWPRHTWISLLETARQPAPYVMPKAPLNGSSAGYGGRP